jgi:hypothetical protein
MSLFEKLSNKKNAAMTSTSDPFEQGNGVGINVAVTVRSKALRQGAWFIPTPISRG